MPELFRNLGRPAGGDVGVSFGPGPRLPQYRTARLLWICDPIKTADPEAGCPSNCAAMNRLPYTVIEYDPKNFPEDTWVLVPCEKHADRFESFPDVAPRD